MIATIKLIKNEGYAFAIPSDLIPTEGQDVYLHVSKFKDPEEFKKMKAGDKVLIRHIESSGKGYDGYDVSLLSTGQR